MELLVGIIILNLFFVVYYLYEVIKHLIHLQELQHKTNELLYEIKHK
jgi:2-iminoacetate synthase ThiH